MAKSANDKVISYYNNSQTIYRIFWMNKKNLAMHYGYWSKNTKNRSEALINGTKEIAEIISVENSNLVLDAGCGVGGTAIWIAENYGSNVLGVTITKKHIPLSIKNAKKRGVSDMVKFELRDFCDTGLPSESFDKIYGIESICYAINKYDFLKEAYRLLKKGGKLVVCDAFVTTDKLNKKLEKNLKDACLGWAVPNFPNKKNFNDDLMQLGYRNIKFTNGTDKVMKSSAEMIKSSNIIQPLLNFFGKLHIVSKINVQAELACQAQYQLLLSEESFAYGIFYAEK